MLQSVLGTLLFPHADSDAGFLGTAMQDEEKNARYRLTPERVAKAVKDLPAEADGIFDAVIIGGGVSGMAAAASLARIGYRCCVLEQGETLGGGSHVFTDRGFEFETGVHYLGKDVEMERTLDFLTCGELKLVPMGTECVSATGEPGLVYDEIVVDGRKYPFVA